jgi:methyl-accepting chemotaxis protein
VRARQWTTRSPAGLVVILLLGVIFLAQRAIAGDAFDGLEANRVAEDAKRIGIALDYEVQLLRNYGATNSIWDNSYTDVLNGDTEAFAADFSPTDLHDIYGLDGVIGVGPDGTARVGGIADGSDAYIPPPADLADSAVLSKMFDPNSEPGAGVCGVASVSIGALVYCGFASYRGDSSGPAAGGLIYVSALNAAGLTRLGERMDLPIGAVKAIRAGATSQHGVAGSLGDLTVATSVVSDEHIALNVTVPTVVGDPVVLEAMRDRPIHRVATGTVLKMSLITLGVDVLIMVAVMLLVARGIKRQVGPLRQTAEAVIASGDRTLRVRSKGSGEIGALGRAIDTMLDGLAARDADLDLANANRERQLRAGHARQRLAEQQERRRTQSLVDETITAVVAQLETVVEQTGAVRGASDSIDNRVESTDSITRTVVTRADHADQAVDEMADSLRRVDGILRLISDVAAQTRLLALNATIEAARAGAAGKGFNVVAGEVKSLAATTAQSTDEITTTIRTVEQRAAAMAAVISDMSTGIADIQAATAEVSTVTRQQIASVEQLNASVQEAIARIRTMTNLSEQLERRAHPRVPASGSGLLRLSGRAHEVRVIDASEGGLRLAVDAGVAIGPGEVVDLDLTIEGRSGLCAHAEVEHVARDGLDAEIGLRLLDPPAEMRRTLCDVVAAAP